MQNNMPSPDNGGTNTKGKRKKAPTKQPKWNLLNLLGTYFLTSAGRPAIVDPTIADGGTDEEWRELIKRTRVHMPPEQLAKPWGQMSRCDFLNWCEDHLPVERRPILFASKQEALTALDFSRLFEGEVNDSKSPSKSLEISKSRQPAQEGGRGSEFAR